MIYKQAFFDLIKNRLKFLKFNGQKNEISTYCPFCEGITGKRHGHLYISLDFPVFFCHRCNHSGSVRHFLSFLLGDSVTEEVLSSYVDLSVIRSGSSGFRLFGLHREIDKSVIEIKNDGLLKFGSKVERKLEYLSSRIGMEVDEKNVFQIYPNIFLTFEQCEDLEKIVRDKFGKEMVNEIETNYLGFFSFFKSGVVFRCIDDELCLRKKLKRYYNLIVSPADYEYDIFVVKNEAIGDKVAKVVVAEGIFDILNVLHSPNALRLREYLLSLFDGSTVVSWSFTCGRGRYYKHLIRLSLFLAVSLLDVIVLSDSDTDVKFYDKLKFNPFINQVKLIFCREKKDFGQYNDSDFGSLREYLIKLG